MTDPQVSADTVHVVAKLARLSINQEEARELAHELTAILAYVARVNLSVEGTAAHRPPTPLRNDVVVQSPPDALLSLAPRHLGRLFLAPQAFDEAP